MTWIHQRQMPPANIVTLMTIRIALLCYAIVVGLLLAGCRGKRFRHWLRPLWTLACASFICHVISAFHFSHHWSHQDAIQNTAKQTQELLGWAFGEGLYFSYLFLVLWAADVLFWWIRPDRYEYRSAWIVYGLHAYLFFIAFNGAVIFESGVTRIGGIAATAIFAAIILRRLAFSRGGS